VALIIAGVKALLVAGIFMHLAFDKGVYSLVFVSSILFAVLFIGLTLMDTSAYLPNMIEGYAPGVAQ
jgi:cytochrome c oxidase subunit 4